MKLDALIALMVPGTHTDVEHGVRWLCIPGYPERIRLTEEQFKELRSRGILEAAGYYVADPAVRRLAALCSRQERVMLTLVERAHTRGVPYVLDVNNLQFDNEALVLQRLARRRLIFRVTGRGSVPGYILSDVLFTAAVREEVR